MAGIKEKIKEFNIFSKEYRKNKLRVVELWSNVLMDYFTRNNSIKAPTREYDFYGNAQAFFSGRRRVSYIFSIDGYGSSLPVGFADYLREGAPEGARLNMITKLEEAQIDWESPRIKNIINTWKGYSEEQGSVDAYNYTSEYASLDNIAYKEASLFYLTKADRKRNRALYTLRTIMIISGYRGPEFDKYVEDVKSICENNLKLAVTRVNRNLSDYLYAFSPFVMGTDKGVFSEVGNTVMPDELIARTRSYDQGKVGEKGIYWLTDIFSNYPTKKEVKKDGVNAENWVIIAETGGGKSFFVKTKILELMADPKYMGTILDIEGDEYIPLAYYIANGDSVEILNMGEGEGNYFDPVEIPVTGIADVDDGMMALSKSFTIALLQTLVGRVVMDNENISPYVRKILNQATEITYENAGVTEEQSTWSNSRGLGLHDIYRTILRMYIEVQKQDREGWTSENAFYNNPGFKDAFDIVVATLEDYLGEKGVRRSVFQRKVSMMDLWDTKLVICSFGMKGKSQSVVDDIQLGLIQLYAGMLTNVRSNFAKAQGKYNVKLFEEFQRYGGLPDADKVFQVAFTGGRKLGDINIIISNEASRLLDDDRFNVFENYTSIAIGAVANAETRRRLCEVLSIEKYNEDLDKIDLAAERKKNRSTANDSVYKYSFLSKLDKSSVTIGKVILPDELAKSNLFRTGVDDNKSESNANRGIEYGYIG